MWGHSYKDVDATPGLLHWLFSKSHRAGISSVQSLSCVQLCNPIDCSTPGFPVHHQLPELTQTHVRRSGINTIISVFSQYMQGIASAGQLILPLLHPPLSPPYTPPEYSYVYAGSSKLHSSQADLLQPALGPSQVCDTEESASLAFRSQMVVLSVMCPRPNPQNL